MGLEQLQNGKTTEPIDIFQTMVESINRVLNLPISVWVPDETAHTLRIKAAIGLPKSYIETAFLGFDTPTVTGQAFQTGKMVIVHDILTDPLWKYKDFAKEQGWRSALILPIKVGDTVIGVVCIYSFVVKEFTELERQLLSSYSAQVGLTLEAEKRRKTLRRLIETGEVFEQLASGSPMQVLEQVVKGACDVTGADCAVVYPYDPENEEFYDQKSVAAFGLNTSLHLNEKPRREGGMAVYVKRELEVVRGDIQAEDPAMLESPFIKREDIKAFMGISLKVTERVLGILYVNFRTPHQFSEEEKDTIRVFANQAAVAIDNARLYQQITRRAEALKRLHEVGSTLLTKPATPITVRDILKDIVETAKNVLGADLVVFYEFIQQRNDFVLPPIEAGEKFVQTVAKDKVYADDVVWTIVKSRKPAYILNSQGPGDLTKDFTVDRVDRPEERFVVREKVRSSSAIPLIVGTELVGILFANFRTPQTFLSSQRELIELFASQAAVAIHNKRLFEQRQTLQKISRNIASILDKDVLLQTILAQSLEMLGCEVGSIALLNKTTNELEFQYAIGKAKGASIKVGEGLMGGAAAKRELICANDVTVDDRYRKDVESTLAELDVPLLVGNELVGVLNAESAQKEAFNDDAQELAMILANQAAIALRNARLYEVTRAVNEVGLELTQGIRLREHEILELIHNKASQLMDTRNMYIALYDETTDTVRFGLAFVDGRKIEIAQEKGWQPRKAGSGKTEEIIRTKRSLFHATQAEGMAWYAQPGHGEYIGQPLASWLGVPMLVADKVVGVVATYHPTNDYVYSEDDKIILQALANQAAIALDNSRLFYARNQKLEALVKFSSEVTQGLRLTEEQVLDLIHQHASDLMDTSNMYIALYDEATDYVRFGLVYLNGRQADIVSTKAYQPRKAGQGRTEEIIRTKEPILHSTQAEGRAWYDKKGHKEYTGAISASWLGVPMMLGEKVLGVVAAYHPTQDYVFSGDDQEILQAMANQAAVALDNAFMVRDMTHVNQRLEALIDFNRAVNSNIQLSEAELLSLIRDQATKLMDTSNMYIALYDELSDTVRFALVYANDQPKYLPSRVSGKGRTEYIIETKKPIFFSTRKEIEDWFAEPGHSTEREDIKASWMAVPMLKGGQVVGVIGIDHPTIENRFRQQDLEILEDIAKAAVIALENVRLYNETKQLQQEIIANKQLGVLGTATAALQHRINNTLNIIPPNLYRLRERVDTSDATIQECLDIVERNVRYTSQLITRIQEPLQNAEIGDVDINAVLDEIVSQVQKAWKDDTTHPFVTTVKKLDERITVIRAPIGQISEVINNLVDNAYRAMKAGGGTLTVTSELVDNLIRIHVQDTGPGIPPSIRQRLFVKPVSSKEQGMGSGLGLWLSRLILQSLGGDITIETTGMTGTVMLVTIPIRGGGIS